MECVRGISTLEVSTANSRNVSLQKKKKSPLLVIRKREMWAYVHNKTRAENMGDLFIIVTMT